jgi:hypothetical protein
MFRATCRARLLKGKEICFQPPEMHRINLYHLYFNLLPPNNVAHAGQPVLTPVRWAKSVTRGRSMFFWLCLLSPNGCEEPW